MVREKLMIKNVFGLHLRPTGILCYEAIMYQSSIRFLSGESYTNVKSVLSVLGACIKCGDELEIVCEGPDENEAMEAIKALIESGLGE